MADWGDDVYEYESGRADTFVAMEDEQWFQWVLRQPELYGDVDYGDE